MSFKLRNEPMTFGAAFEQFDVKHYKDIVEKGYSYDPNRRSLVAFFPVYPLSARVVRQLTGLPTTAALLVTANLYLLGTFLVFAAYLRDRFPVTSDAANTPRLSLADASLLAFCFFPTTFFFRIPYSEPTFLFFASVAFLGMSRRWPLLAIAAAVGAATATRAVGVALLVPLALHILSTSTTRLDVVRKSPLLIVGSAGLLTYMLFNYVEFGDALAFAKTQDHWRIRERVPGWEKWLSLASWEPFWSPFIKGSPYAWLQEDWSIFSLAFMNPIYYLGTILLVGLGAWNRWLTREEIAVSIPLLLIPYVTRAHEWGLLSHARFAAVVFPAYIVMGHLLAKLPPAIAIGCIALGAFLMGAYAALFAAGHGFY